MAISPWGEVLADLGAEPGFALVDLDPAEVAQSRKRIAALSHDRPFEGP
jgi:predicted amidohydrolase